MAEVDFNKLRQECEANDMIVNDTNGNPSRCVFSSQAGNNEVTLRPLPSASTNKIVGSTSLKGGKKKEENLEKAKKKALRENHVAKVRRQSIEQKNVDAKENEYVMDYYNI